MSQLFPVFYTFSPANSLYSSVVMKLNELFAYKPLEKVFSDFLNFQSSRTIEEISGLPGSSFSMLVAHYFSALENELTVITPDSTSAVSLHEDLSQLIPDAPLILFPFIETSSLNIGVMNPHQIAEFQKALIELKDNPRSISIIPMETLLMKVLSPTALEHEYFILKKGDEINRDDLTEFLVDFNYSRVDAVEEIGDFAIRGSLIDVFPFGSDQPVRIDFFGDEIDNIRTFDVFSQRSENSLESIRLSSYFISDKDSPHEARISDYFSSSCHILLYQREILESRFEQLQQHIPEETAKMVHAPSEILSHVLSFKTISHRTNQKNPAHYHFPFTPASEFQGSLKLFFNYLKNQLKLKHSLNHIVIYAESETRKTNLIDFIDSEFEQTHIPVIKKGCLSKGFEYPAKELVILTEHEIFNRVRRPASRKHVRTSAKLLRRKNQFNPGDLVVHIDYGIAIYHGVEKLSMGNQPVKDVVRLEYRDEDILYVSLDKIHRIQKYTAVSEGAPPVLSKLGGSDWKNIRKKSKKAIEKIASDLIQIYAQRITGKGFPFREDTLWQREMESSFPFEETPDQLESIAAIKQDMEAEKPMDRVLCGDVGFGKTEVAIRAAFKAVQDGKQVMVLAPTTLLSHQHFHTFSQRLSDFPVCIEELSRFRSRAEQTEVLNALHKGSVDIIIGTHRLLSNDVRFKDLGLLIVDEEQRFGVTHKEKIKKFRATIDVLTMSATPIPRTLHMALMGARDLSQIETPPKNRLPVYTEIINWDDAFIRKVLLREINRQGQVFFVHNRVETIDAVRAKIAELVPSARVIAAHGQMKEKDLEKVMDDFYSRKYDVLVATMIIENGIDIPNCNTILINDAHKFGLSQLYQLRGRVGRAESQAYAYLIAPNFKKLTRDAIKRLYAIQEYTELGSGLKIAMKDLEIRGSGNLLGHQQSGHINAIGYDLYVKLLQETIEKIKSQEFQQVELPSGEKLVECSVEIKNDVFFPDEYIGSKSEKAFLYYRLGQFNSFESLDTFREELQDRFGEIPDAAENLLFLHYLRIWGGKNLIQRISLNEKKIVFTFHPDFLNQKTSFDKLIQKIHTLENYRTRFKQEKNLILAIETEKGSLFEDNYINTKKLLQDLHP